MWEHAHLHCTGWDLVKAKISMLGRLAAFIPGWTPSIGLCILELGLLLGASTGLHQFPGQQGCLATAPRLLSGLAFHCCLQLRAIGASGLQQMVDIVAGNSTEFNSTVVFRNY